MAFFREASKNNQKYLVVVHRPENADQTGFKLPVHPPIGGSRSGGFIQGTDTTARLYRELRQSHGHVEYLLCPLEDSTKARNHTFSTLGRRIIDGEVQWGTVLKTTGIFSFMERYWEWLEDILSRSRSTLKRTGLYDALSASLFTYSKCPSIIRAFCEAWCPETNTLHTDVGEMSISLADLWHIGGLPVTGDLYEEVIPSFDELNGSVAHQRAKSLPMSCQHLFAAYLDCLVGVYDHEDPKVPLSHWVNYWCKKSMEYKKPANARRGASRLKDTQNSSGDIAENPQQWSQKDEELFARLHVEDNSREESFLAAFISCWLCLFALPSNDATIRPSTFKMASLIAQGRTHCLAVPVLANIYRGLNITARSSAPERGDACLPWHYVIGWIARYFGTHHRAPSSLPGPMMVSYSGVGGAKNINDHDGRDLIHRARDVFWLASVPRREKMEFKVDDGELSTREQVFIRSVRSSFLIFHQDGRCFSEPYSPYRFARKFGFFQVVPKELPNDDRRITAAAGKQLWERYFTPKSRLKIVFPASLKEYHRHISSNFSACWLEVHGTYLFDGRSSLVATVNRGTIKAKQNTPVVKIKNIELPQPHKEAIPDLHHDPKRVGKSKEDCPNSREKRHLDKAVAASGSSSHSDVNWKRLKKGPETQVIPYSLEDIDINWTNFLNGVPSSGDFDINFPRILENEPFYVADLPQRSEPSTNGPDAFTLVLQDHHLPTTYGENEVSSSAPQILEGTSCQVPDNGAENVRAISQSSNRTTEVTSSMEPLKRTRAVTPPTHQRLSPNAVSEFNSGRIIEDCYQHLTSMFWNRLRTNISNYPLEDLASKRNDAYRIFDEMKCHSRSDLSGLETLLNALFDNATHHSAAQKDISGRLSAALFEEKHSILSKQLVDVKAAEADHLKEMESSKSSLAELMSNRETLEKKVEALKRQEAEIASLLASREEEWKSMTVRASELESGLNELESTPRLQPGEHEALEKMAELLELSRQELLDFNLFA